MVSVDGKARGITPLTLRDLPLGTRTIVITRSGYEAAERRVTLTADRPSRSIEVMLEPLQTARANGSRQNAPSPANAGGVVIESRPSGAAVTIDGAPSGATPLTVVTLAPGTHTIVLEREGYKPWRTTIEVKAGERARVAASLVSVQER